jgi:hypothetical protein
MIIIPTTITAYGSIDDEQGEANTPYFSVEPLDTWIYETSFTPSPDSYMTFGTVNTLTLYPVDQDMEAATETLNGVVAQFKMDKSFDLGNAPLDRYVKFKVKDYTTATELSREQIELDGQPAIKIVMKSTAQDVMFQNILTTYNDEFYEIIYSGNTANYNKYLPEFEQILETFKFDGFMNN